MMAFPKISGPAAEGEMPLLTVRVRSCFLRYGFFFVHLYESRIRQAVFLIQNIDPARKLDRGGDKLRSSCCL